MNLGGHIEYLSYIKIKLCLQIHSQNSLAHPHSLARSPMLLSFSVNLYVTSALALSLGSNSHSTLPDHLSSKTLRHGAHN